MMTLCRQIIVVILINRIIAGPVADGVMTVDSVVRAVFDANYLAALEKGENLAGKLNFEQSIQQIMKRSETLFLLHCRDIFVH